MAEPEKKTCLYCGKPFVAGTFWARYCSESCKQKAKRAKQKQAQKQPS